MVRSTPTVDIDLGPDGGALGAAVMPVAVALIEGEQNGLTPSRAEIVGESHLDAGEARSDGDHGLGVGSGLKHAGDGGARLDNGHNSPCGRRCHF
ncbi:hypothetical protein [Streptomyces sp. NPDC047097]|uniref:hypothetical protein n=1 Tax=Streptomyces sp. NPDC047097 TaxID=3155260 RepID=UPI0033E76547